MTPGQALVLGLVQGLTEFFPISSSGHLVLTEALLGVNPLGVAFEVAIHVATVIAVLAYYARRIADLAAGAVGGDRAAWTYLGKIVVGSLPAGALGVAFEDEIGAAFDAPVLTAVFLLVTGAVLWSTRRLRGAGGADGDAAERRGDLTWGTALWVGVAQALALLPGISRSGMTVAAALWRGMAPLAAAEFSFLLSVPAILGAALLETSAIVNGETGAGPIALVAGFVAAGVSGYVALVYLVRWLARGHLHRFAYYCWVVGGLFLIGWALR
jgi:undecaprenyl-diphosphatase